MKKLIPILFSSIFLFSCGEKSAQKETNENSHKPHHETHKESHDHKGAESHNKHGHNHANKHMHNHNSVPDLINSFESPERALTQKPYEVISLLGAIEGRKILDIGAGSGYFSFKMAERGADVIAGDVDDEFLAHLTTKCAKIRMAKGSVTPKKLPFDSPALSSQEVDDVIIVNTYHHIENRVAYFSKVLDGLKPNGRLMVVDFMKKHFEEEVHGPPYEMRISSEVVTAELKEAGFTQFELNDELLPFQFILIASNNSKSTDKSAKKEEFKVLKTEKINKKIADLKDDLNPKQIMKEYYTVKVNSNEGNEEISMTERKVSANKTIITLVHDNLLDDSMKGKKYVMELDKKNTGKWIVSSLKTNWKCWDGRGHKDWGIENCQ